MSFINENFMLRGETAKQLYHTFAEGQPIIDYHCHLSPKLIAEDHRFSDITELMLAGDHYKWRALRSFGVEEKFITGDAGSYEKFRAYAGVMPYCIGNPLYHWTHLELKRYFGIDECLTPDTARNIYDRCTGMLAQPGFTARGLIKRSRVELLCTTDDPADDLSWHKQIKESGYSVRVLPAFRPDKAVNINKDTFLPYIRQTGVATYRELLGWLESRIEFFHGMGCRLADHGLDRIPYAEGDPGAVFATAMRGEGLTDTEVQVYQTALLRFFAREYCARGWCMQLHFGALRNNNSVMFRKLGPDTGYDAINDNKVAEPLARLLDSIEAEDALPRTILYSLNPNDNYTIAALMGCYQKAPVRSKLQLGSGWWFNDQRDGMEAQLRAYANLGTLGGFVGMLTDSRSFISYTRHEYFRRILCNLIGGWVDAGEYPCDEAALGEIIRGISYKNAKEYFNF